jgi:hypothetical protein
VNRPMSSPELEELSRHALGIGIERSSQLQCHFEGAMVVARELS